MENIETLLAAVAQTQGFDDDPVVAPAPSPKAGNSDSKPGNSGGVQSPGEEVSGNVPTSTPVGTNPPPPPTIGAVVKRKRGRPPKGQHAAKLPPPKREKLEDEDEEDVCFICFDGGSLVLCDRKGCPKAYHPSCIKRDEEFFASKAKWICGWHICSVCMKASHYMCYTCTYSLCKGCAKATDYVCVRGNKGFCSTCMKTIMLIENKDQANNQLVQVDFDDKTSWEYLFKVYWVFLKEKLSLTYSELTRAMPPFPDVAYDRKPNKALRARVDGRVSVSSTRSGHLELNSPCIETHVLQNDGLRMPLSGIVNYSDKLNCTDAAGVQSHKTEIPDNPVVENDRGTSKGNVKQWISESMDKKESQWASKELLEFVAFMRHGDKSAMLQSDVQTLLLDYVKRNNLWDSRQRSLITCDQTLQNLFGKPHIGHIEMLKLLELHFPGKEDSWKKNSLIPTGFVKSDFGADGNVNSVPAAISNRNEERASQNDLVEYAAIDAHNINLIYLRRDLMKNLLEDPENLDNKVIGSIVRIRALSHNQKLDIYRLVQVVGTIKMAKPYKVGERTANVMLEVLNLDEKEVVSIDAISNDEFTEDECRWFRKSISCGLVKQLTVGDIKKVATALQPARIKDMLEKEVSRLNHLRDQASRSGCKKELREYLDRLELLKSPEERRRRIAEIPEIHADPKMSLNYESEIEGKPSKKVELVRPSFSEQTQNRRKSISSNKRGKEDQPVHSQNRKMDSNGTHDSGKTVDQGIATLADVGDKNEQAVQRSEVETWSTTASVQNSPSVTNMETEKLWHYRDPNGQIQGPFSMMHMRIWNTTGLLPPDMRIWTNHEQYDSVLLTDALIGDPHGGSESSCKHSPGSQENRASEGIGESEGTHGATAESKEADDTATNHASVLSEKNSRHVNENASDSSWPQCWDLLNNKNSSADDVQANARCQESDELNHGLGNREKNLNEPTQDETSAGNELQNQSKTEDEVKQPAEENSRPLNIDLSSNLMESESVITPVSNSLDLNKQIGNIDQSDLQSPPLANTQNQPPTSGILELLSPAPRSSNDKDATEAKETKDTAETKPSEMLNVPVLDSGLSCSGAPVITAGGMELPDLGNEWCGYSSTPVKPSIPEWDSGLASATPAPFMKTEVLDEYPATSMAYGHQISHAPASQPATSNMPSWLEILNEPIEFDALGEESVSDLLAEVDAMESQGVMYSPTSAIKFAREFLEECKDDCFSSIEDFNPLPDPQRCDASGSTGEMEMQMTSQSSCNPIEAFDAFDSLRKSSANSSASSEGGTNAQVYSGDAGSEFHPPALNNPAQEMVGHGNTATSNGADPVDPGWGNVQGNINLVTVQGNVNLVLGGPTQGMANIGWGTNPGTGWVNPSINLSPRNGSLPWDGQPQPQPQQQQQQQQQQPQSQQSQQQRKYSGERYTSPRSGYQSSEAGFSRGRPPRGRQAYTGGGFLRKGPRIVCKFYEKGLCKKGAFCGYLHP
ncbi:zinc finger CCCH domain-containing protein 44-like [Andrographis paniculata]|uniref:zinc finger CCCH domain-containing protein 44-like n=1 Tax=Andrographis paniculata TaxID=175694 RepID=UPI0021E9254F|nr:zinc finger CCCH domain-containing protein 44-like [Andrographis paniculata]